MPVLNRTASAFDHETLTVSTVALPLTAATYAPSGLEAADFALITCEGADVRYLYDGDTPTGAIGHLLVAGSAIKLDGIATIAAIKFIRAGGTDAALWITYERD